MEAEFTSVGINREDWLADYVAAWASLRRIFGMPPPDARIVEEVLRKFG